MNRRLRLLVIILLAAVLFLSAAIISFRLSGSQPMTENTGAAPSAGHSAVILFEGSNGMKGARTANGRVLIEPTWESDPEKEEKAAVTLRIDPGEAFGTGAHETTKLAIQGIRKYIHAGDTVMDIGTGSGILSIIALKLGAAHAVGTDLDPCAVPAVADNKKANGIPEDAFDMIIGNLIDDPEIQRTVGENAYDLVTANILADVLVPLMPAVARAVKPDGVCITSGILQGQEQKVIRAAEKAGLHLVETTQQGEWMSVTVQR